MTSVTSAAVSAGAHAGAARSRVAVGDSLEVADPDAGTNGLLHWIAGARSNWLWLAEISTWERALDLGSDATPQTPGLAEHFATVHCARLDPRLLGRAGSELTAEGYANVAPTCATPVELPYREGTFDCVALNDGCAALGGNGVGTIEDRLLQECRRILRRGGCLYLGISNPYWRGRAAYHRSRSDSVLGVTRRLRRAGFSLVRVYCAEPSYDRPRCIIPLDRRAVLAYERLSREPSPHARLRRVLAWLGLGGVLYPSLIYLAYR